MTACEQTGLSFTHLNVRVGIGKAQGHAKHSSDISTGRGRQKWSPDNFVKVCIVSICTITCQPSLLPCDIFPRGQQRFVALSVKRIQPERIC